MMENDDTKISDGDEIIFFVWSALEEIGSTVTNFWKNDDQMVTRPHLTNSANEIGNNRIVLLPRSIALPGSILKNQNYKMLLMLIILVASPLRAPL